jgi:pyruvate,water dikinase
MKDAPTKDAPTKDAAPTGDRVLRGIGVSPGQATAPVQVVTDPYAPGLEPGEVLVAHTTDPAWTPLFLTASAVVIDLGGPLSHGAVIARELGIPCVINVKHASTQLASGEVVTVDGTAGEVYPQPGSAAQKLLPPSTLTSAPLT